MKRTLILVAVGAIAAGVFAVAAHAAIQNYVGTIGGNPGTIFTNQWSGTGNALNRQSNRGACVQALPNTHYWVRVRYVRTNGTVQKFGDAPRGTCVQASIGPSQGGEAVYAQCRIMKDSGGPEISRAAYCWSDF